MATYKVLQDIEAEDKFLGPLTLKQCIFAAIAVVSGWLSYVAVSQHVWVLAMPLLPVIVVTGFLAFPWGRDQPTEIWLLAKIRFMFKPRKRIWDQTGIQELVRISAPPKVEQFTGDNLSQTEVRSRLKALADTIDTRGWAIKGASYEESQANVTAPSDRLVDGSTLPSVTNPDADAGTDIFDSPASAQIDSKITSSAASHRGDLTTRIDDTRDLQAGLKSGAPQPPVDNLWFMGPTAAPGQATATTQTITASDDTGLSPLFSSAGTQVSSEDQEFLNNLKHKRDISSHTLSNHRTIGGHNVRSSDAQKRPLVSPDRPVTPGVNPATIELARNNDRNIDSLAREAGNDEVVISLH